MNLMKASEQLFFNGFSFGLTFRSNLRLILNKPPAVKCSGRSALAMTKTSFWATFGIMVDR